VQRDGHAIERHAARGLGPDGARDLDALARLARPGGEADAVVERRLRRRRVVEQERLQAAERARHRRRRRLRLDAARAPERGDRADVARDGGREDARRARHERRHERLLGDGRERHVEQEERDVDEAGGVGRRDGVPRGREDERAVGQAVGGELALDGAGDARRDPRRTARARGARRSRCRRAGARRACGRAPAAARDARDGREAPQPVLGAQPVHRARDDRGHRELRRRRQLAPRERAHGEAERQAVEREAHDAEPRARRARHLAREVVARLPPRRDDQRRGVARQRREPRARRVQRVAAAGATSTRTSPAMGCSAYHARARVLYPRDARRLASARGDRDRRRARAASTTSSA
jgi:hypothetical protein